MISVLAALGCASLLAVGGGEAAAAPAWKKLHAIHAKSGRKALVRQLKRDGVRQPETLLKHKYLVRLEIRNAGGGAAKHSEVVVRFRSLPKRVFAKAWSPGGRHRTAAQLGAWGGCKTKRGAVGRTCPHKYNGRGFRDVTSAFTARNMLFVHDPKRRGAGNTIIYFAADRSQKYMWYYVVPKRAWPSFGTPRVRVKKYLVPKAAPPARLPGDPPDPGNPVKPRLPADPPINPPTKVTPRKAPPRWTTANNLHQAMSKGQLTALMKKDGVTHPGYLLTHRFVMRVALTQAGGGSRSRSELQLRFVSRPKKALGKAWADRREMRRAQIGAANRCRPLRRGKGGPEGHRCPVHFNNLGWRNLISAFTSTHMRLVTDPNNPRQGNVVMWLAFDQSQSGLRHKFVMRPTLPTFGKGKLALGFYAVSDGSTPIPHRPSVVQPKGYKTLGTAKHRAMSRSALAARMRRDGLRSAAYLLRHKYLVRLSVTRAGGGRGYRSEVVVRMSSRPKAALGTAWSDHRQRWGAQVGARTDCRAQPVARNPYGSYRQLRWHACPMQYNGLGWRNLISAFKSKEMMFITASMRRGGGNQVVWLAYDGPQALLYKLAVNDQAHRFSMGTVYAEKFVHGVTSTPSTPHTSPTYSWTEMRGAHSYLHRNQLYWAIRRDGFSNPWYLLKKKYLVRIQISASRQASHTVLQLPNAPGMAIGRGYARGTTRSAVQAGTVSGCKATAGRQPYCPLHYGNLGWRNLSSGFKGRDLLFVTKPSYYGYATTTVWMAFDNPQSVIKRRYLSTARGRARVTITRYRW